MTSIPNRIATFIRRLVNTQPIINELNALRDNVRWLNAEHDRAVNLQYRDVLIMLDRITNCLNTTDFAVETQHPIAFDSDDHKFPRGTRENNTRSPRFVAACERYFSKPLRYLDLGCAGGGMVLEFLLRGHLAAGLEGSDYSKRSLRAEWRVIPKHLMVCDISKPFRVTVQQQPAKFDVISAWEVLEHIGRDDLPQLMNNIRQHLSDGGFVGSITTTQDADPQQGPNTIERSNRANGGIGRSPIWDGFKLLTIHFHTKTIVVDRETVGSTPI